MLEVDDDPVEARAGHDLDGLNAGNGRNRAEGGTPLTPLPAKTVEGFRYRGNQIRNSVRVAGEARRPKKLTARQDIERSISIQAGTRPPKNGINAGISVCGRLEVKITCAPVWSTSPPRASSKSVTRRAIAGAGST